MAMVNMNNLLNGKDSRWLQLEVCREFQRNKCTRPDTECKFAHPPANVEVQNGRVTACYDSIKSCQSGNVCPGRNERTEESANRRQCLWERALLSSRRRSLFVPDVLFFVSRFERSSGGIKFQRDVRGQRQDSFEGFVLGPILLSCPDVSRRVYLPCNRQAVLREGTMKSSSQRTRLRLTGFNVSATATGNQSGQSDRPFFVGSLRPLR
ncbi:uncharacterized protein LOC116428922 isoform X2 [Nomia melanderi]|uniref:uncharacterized protein LOC116428922 isoform X2 n=1 Tax=Nomia melanderi TaxID=2448451 RepID=UPI003FCC4683